MVGAGVGAVLGDVVVGAVVGASVAIGGHNADVTSRFHVT